MNEYLTLTSIFAFLVIAKIFVDRKIINIDNDIISDTCGDGAFYDKSQFLYKSLHEYFNVLTKGEKRFLRGECEKNVFTRLTIDEILKIELNQITNAILEKVNQNKYFNFSLINYENVIVMKDKMKNRRYIIDFLVNDKNTHYGLRLKMDVVKFVINDNTNKTKTPLGENITCTALTTPAFKRYYVGYPALEQLIPLPTHVIPTGNLQLSDYGKETIVPIPYQYLHMNSIIIENTNLTLDINNKCNTTCQVDGTQYTSLPYGFETRRDDGMNKGPYVSYFTKRNKWPKLDDEPDDDFVSPCSYRDGMCWDDKGIPVKKKNFNWNNKMTLPDKDCLGKLSSTVKYPRRPNYWANNYQIPQNSGEYFWLFDRTRGASAMPNKK
jgi:hypothetical protein